jgi:hypothetical protein
LKGEFIVHITNKQELLITVLPVVVAICVGTGTFVALNSVANRYEELGESADNSVVSILDSTENFLTDDSNFTDEAIYRGIEKTGQKIGGIIGKISEFVDDIE